MARFVEERNYRRGEKRRQAKEIATQSPKSTNLVASARRVPGAIKPTVERSRGHHQRAFELDPTDCDERELAAYAAWEHEQDLLDLIAKAA